MDVRSRKTEAAIDESFISLLKQKPFHEISIREVCDRASIHRSTFYKHYKNIYEWRGSVERNALEYVHRTAAEAIKESDMRSAIMNILNDIRDYADLATVLISKNWESDSFQRVLRSCLEEPGALARFNTDTSRSGLDSTFLICGCIGVLVQWLHDGFAPSAEEVADCIIRMTE